MIDNIRGSRALFSNRNFSFLLGGQVVSQIGENLNRVALFWFVYQISHHIGEMVLVGVLQTLPPLLFGWLNGVLLDRHSKKWIMIGVDITRGVLVLLIPILHAVHLLSLPLLFLLVFLISMMSGIFGPALYSALPMIVRREHLLSANALMQTTGQIGLLAGPALGGLLAILWGASGEMAVNAVTFILSAFFLLFVKIAGSPDHRAPTGVPGIFPEVREGFRFVFAPRRHLLTPFLFMTLFGMVTGPINILLLLLSRHISDRGAEGFGDLLSAFGTGMLLSSVLLSLHRPANIVSWVVKGYSLAGILFLAIGQTASFRLDLLLFSLWGAAVSLVIPLSQTMVQHLTPPHLLARVLTVMGTGFLTGIMTGMVIFPHLSTPLGLPAVFELMGGLLLLPVLWKIWATVMQWTPRDGRTRLPGIDSQKFILEERTYRKGTSCRLTAPD